MKGKMIVLYGANNLGKSKQSELLEQALREGGLQVMRVKYPAYDCEPTGPILNAILREGLESTELETQRLFAQNRRDFEPILQAYLESGITVIAEDYTGTGIAWGMVRGVDLSTLEEMNHGIFQEDCAILLYGERFTSGIETSHKNEGDQKLWDEAQAQHLELAERYGWHKVYATRSEGQVHDEIMQIALQTLGS